MRKVHAGATAPLILLLLLLSGCAGPSLPDATDWEDQPKCPAKLAVLNAKHQWSMVEDSVKVVQFRFANLSSIKFTLLMEAPGITWVMGAPPATSTDWYLKDPHGVVVWYERGSWFGGGPSYEYEWSRADLGRMTGTWTLHLDGLSNAHGTIRMEGTMHSCGA